MATEVKKAICTVVYWTANQSALEAIYGVGGYYTSLSAFLTGEARNLVSADEIAVAEIYNAWPSGLDDNFDTGSSWTTDSTRYIKITVVDGHRHDATPESGFFLKNTPSNDRLFIIRDVDIVCEYLDMQQASSGAKHFMTFDGTKSFSGSNCLFHDIDGASSTTTSVFREATTSTNISFENSVVWSAGTYRYLTTDADDYVFNKCTFYQASSVDSLVLRNGAFTDCFCYCGSTGLSNGEFYSACTGDYNASRDFSAPGSNSLTGRTTADFVDYLSTDFRTASDSDLADSGSIDFIGFLLEESALLPINLPLAMNHFRQLRTR